ncbi:MAG TPA: AAA family ATPase [Candidatus Acidoferrales bacterium]|nr:AAA family ATPase [Candidatus Acidoferrales bacterium]
MNTNQSGQPIGYARDGVGALVDAMKRTDFYPDAPPSVELKQTHISYVFIAGDYVYKIKKAVRFPFIDCRQLERRFRFCLDEVRFNSRLAPQVYLGVFAILKREGSFKLGPEVRDQISGAVEYAVKMRRLPEDKMLDRLLTSGRVNTAMIDALAEHIARFHAGAPATRAREYGPAAAVWSSVVSDIAQNEAFVGQTLSEDQFAAIDDFCRAFITIHWRLLNDRSAAGRVREGHGDLRAEHVCVRGDQIDVIDCVEFSERLRYGDVASDVSFLAMDLERLGAPEFANQLVESYAAIARDEELPVLVPFYKCYRACVRGKVESLRSMDAAVSPTERERSRALARQYFALAYRYARIAPPVALAVCGLSGTGKSTVARLLQHRTGFRIVSSDRVRKRLAALSPREHAPADYGTGLYSDRFTRITYAAMLAEVENLLKDGRGVILDATFKLAADRDALRSLAAKLCVPLLFFECVAGEDDVMRRLKQRATMAGEESDATPEVYRMQREEFEALDEIPPRSRRVIDTAQPRDRVLGDIEDSLERLLRCPAANRSNPTSETAGESTRLHAETR